MGPRIVPVFQTAEEFESSYRWCGIVCSIVASVFMMILATMIPERVTPGIFYLGAIPVSYALSWLIVHMTFAIDPQVQRRANKAFNVAYWHTYPVAYALSALVFGLLIELDVL